MERSQRCPKCGETKPLDAFSPGNRRCKPCKSRQAVERYWRDAAWREERKAYHREQQRAVRADPEKREVILKRLREKRANNPEWRAHTLAKVTERRKKFVGRNLAITAKKRAKVANLPYNLTPEWVQELWEREPFCVYCRCPLRCAEGYVSDSSPTLDRVLPAYGYTTSNTVLACFRCNNLKRDATVDEIERLAVNIRRVLAGRR